MSELGELIEDLERIVKKIKKNPAREYTQKHILEKRLAVKNLKKRIQEKLSIFIKFDVKLSLAYKEKFKKLYCEGKNVFKNKNR